MNSGVDFFFTEAKAWQLEMTWLREIILGCGLQEVLKWGKPCYVLGERNIVLIHGFKSYCAVLFFKGALLSDESGALIQQTQATQAARQMRFSSVQEIQRSENLLRANIAQAIDIEKAGLTVRFKQTHEFDWPPEFVDKLKESAELQTAFKKLTPGRQRAYLLHFSSAKLSATRLGRVERSMPKILLGQGLDD